MPVFEHPLGLFTLEYPDHWRAEYDAESAGVTFHFDRGSESTGLSVLPLAVTGAELSPLEALADAAARLGVSVLPDRVEVSEEDGVSVAYAEGPRGRATVPGSWYRLWVFSRGPLTLLATQFGPGAGEPTPRFAADATISSLEFPEVLPLTPEQFRSQVLDLLRREHPGLQVQVRDVWTIDVADEYGQPLLRLNLEEIYPVCPREANGREEFLRQQLEEALSADA